MIKTLKKMVNAQQFSPTWVGVIVNPFYFARSGLDRAIRRLAPKLNGVLLDVGCGTKPYADYFESVTDYVGLEVATGNPSDTLRHPKGEGSADCCYDGERFPFAARTFDAVLCNQVLEHVFTPTEFIAEVARVLKPGGRLLLTVPFVWDEHEQPHDYARYTSFGLHALLEQGGLEVEVHDKINADPSVIFQLANAYFYKISMPLPSILRFGLTITLMALVNFTGVVFRFVLPRNPDLFLDQIILARKPDA